MGLALIWLAIFSGFFVFIEPAPIDVLLLAALVVLPFTGLLCFDRANLVYLFFWALIVACQLIASLMAVELNAAVAHTLVSLYLCLVSVTIAAFVARSPADHARLIVHAYVASALMGAALGIVGYFDLLPGAAEALTRYGRASAAFKVPNVYAPFLVPPILFLLHHALTQSLRAALLSCLGMAILGFAVFLSFSRGAWVNLIVAGLVYAWLAFVTARTERQRMKVTGLVALALLVAAGLILLALESEAVARLFDQRVAIGHSHDLGPEGRFGGQLKAIGLILDNPLGLGHLQFGGVHHHEEAHNIYLTAFLGSGWPGGLLYLALVVMLIGAGLRAVLRRRWASPFLLAAFAAVVGVCIEGYVIETDHWRHFYIVAGLLWGLSLRPVLPARRLPRLIPKAHVRRPARIVLPYVAIQHSALMALRLGLSRPPRRPSRLRSRVPVPPLHLVRVPRRGRRSRRPRRACRIVGVA